MPWAAGPLEATVWSAMGHFEREARSWVSLAPILIGLLLGVLGTFAFSFVEAVRIDRCLDLGGSYDYESQKCDLASSHPAPG